MSIKFRADRRCLAPADDAGAGGTPAPAGAPPAANPAAAPPAGAAPAAGGAKWWEDDKTYDADTRNWLAARGLTEDDPLAVLPKAIKGHRAAEARIGKGLDSIMDRPAKGQSWADWAAANADALGLPAEAKAYAVEAPKDWPKDIPWDAAREERIREIAFKHRIPAEAHQAYVGAYAETVKEIYAEAEKGLSQARTEMDTDLRRDWGQQLEARKTRAAQAMQTLAEKAGMTADHIEALSQTMSGASSDATVIRIFDVVAEILGDDTGFAMGRGAQKFGMTPAEARAELARFEGPEGEYGKALAESNMAKLAELKARRNELHRLAAG